MISRASAFLTGLKPLTLFLLLGFPGFAAAAGAADNGLAPAQVDQGALTRELTLTRQSADRMTMTMWMPEEFWQVALGRSQNLSAGGTDKYLAVIHPYLLIAVLDAQKGIAAFHYTDSDTLIGETSIEDSRGNLYKPLATDSLNDEIRNLILILRPLMGNMMGAMGQHMEFMVFSNVDPSGKPVADAKGNGALIVHVGDTPMRYRLPIASLLPQTVDPKSGESFPGTYRYNPYTGSKLTVPPHGAPAPDPKAK